MSETWTNASQWAEKYRPQSLNDVVGQDATVSMIRGFIRRKQVPSTILISGPTGLGKTTLAFIIAYAINELKYGASTMDIVDKNIGSEGKKTLKS